jgi:hypothetical protein
MCKWLCSVLLLGLTTTNVAISATETDTADLDKKLELLDKISYHPSLLPIIMQNKDFLELTPDQLERLTEWRKKNVPAMLEKMQEVAKGRIDFVARSLDPKTSEAELVREQHQLFKLQEEVLAYKLSCRHNILQTFTPKQWDALQLIMADQQ